MSQWHQRGVDVLVDVLDAIDQVDQLSQQETRQLLKEVAEVMGEMLAAKVKPKSRAPTQETTDTPVC